VIIKEKTVMQKIFLTTKMTALMIATCAFINTACSQQTIRFSQRQLRLPVLQGKKDNPVVLLRIDNGSSSVSTIDQLGLALSHQVKAIGSISLWNLGADSVKALQGQLQKAKKTDSIQVTGQSAISFNNPVSLQPGVNYLIIGVTPSASATLDDSIGVRVVSAGAGNNKLAINEENRYTGQRVGVAVRQHLQDKVFMHRIPGLATAKDGSLLAIYDARFDSGRDLQGNIDIGLSRSTDQGQTWQPMQIVLDMGTWGNLPQKFNGVSDACILVDKTNGDIYIAGLWMYGMLDPETGKWVENLTDTSSNWNHQWRSKGSQPGRDVKRTSQFLITKSTDNGLTWSEPVNLTQQIKPEKWWLWAPAPGQGITMANGTLVMPTQGRDAKGHPFSNITYSEDHGKTWKISKAAVSEGTTENMVVELTDGTLMLNMRANSNRNDTSDRNGRAVAVTKDLGKKWTIHPSSHKALIEPTCMASIIRHDYIKNGQKKSMLVFCNPASKIARHDITVKVSHDDGLTWQSKQLLDEFKGRGYSCITSVNDNKIGVLYESSQADMVFQSFSLEELLN
jgi:sialidase-1